MACSQRSNRKGYRLRMSSKLITSLTQILSIIVIFATKTCTAKPVGYSFAKFSGPVSGPEKEVYVHDNRGGDYPHVDYIAKPDYHFSYGVEDPKTRVLQNRHETRDGDEVRGEYSVVDPDGTHRRVRYKADKVNGFQAEVIRDGKSSSLHGHHDPYESPEHNDYYQHHHHHHHHNPQHNNHGHSQNYIPPQIHHRQPPHSNHFHGAHKKIHDDDDDDHSDDDDDHDDDGY